MKVTEEIIKECPKVLLHDHLDGGVRPSTIIEIAKKRNVELPSYNETELAEWFHRGANRGNLSLYLEGFGLTTAVMQTEEELERIAFEAIEDLADDNVVYAEIRFAPVFHTSLGLNQEQIVNAVLNGLSRGRERTGVEFGLIICAMRDMDNAEEMAELAVSFREQGVVGFDLAGDEYGHPPKKHLDGFNYILRQNFNMTIHAGEAFGKESIWQALQYCGSHRLGHGTRLIDDMVVIEDRVITMGTLAQHVLDRRIPLEMCLSSNVQTGAAKNFQDHPFPKFFAKKFRVTLNTDNRLMSNTSMTKEFQIAVEQYDLGIHEIEKLVINGMKSAFINYDRRCEIIYDVIKPRFYKIKNQYGL